MSEPRRVGLMKLLMSSTGCQFVIPVYQRNYTWRADSEVKQYLSDLQHVLHGEYKNHFLGILIYLEKSIDFSAHELSIIDGQQRLTTTFLTIYAVREIFKNNGEDERVQQLEGQYLTNPYHRDKIKYKLKPLVADDDVYRCIVEDRMGDIVDKDSSVLANYRYIQSFLDSLTGQGFSPNDILLALDKLYVVCVPISEEDNAQKIFESINATGVKLTSADLIRNYLLMNLDSEIQDSYYASYWRKIEDNISTDSKELELFFRMYLAVKTFNLVPKNSVYRSFVDWVELKSIPILDLFKDLLSYSKIYFMLNNSEITSLDANLVDAVTDFRKLQSDLPMAIVMEFFRLYNDGAIDAVTLGKLIFSINSYLIRRSICDMDAQNISRLFPAVLKAILDNCDGDYTNILKALNQNLVGNNADTSGSYMPTDIQMHEILHSANVYKRPVLRIILDRIELNNNPAPVDLSALSIEHLMPQTPTDKWLAELNVDEDKYYANLHRLGNLTLAAKSDNSKMSNLKWEYKNTVLASTAHLKMNIGLIAIQKWDIAHIETRTNEMIDSICTTFPYPDVSMSKTANFIVDEKSACDRTAQYMFSGPEFKSIKKNRFYSTVNKSDGYVLMVSKMYPEGVREKYWFGYREIRYQAISDCKNKHCVFICRYKNVMIFDIPREFLDSYLDNYIITADENGVVKHYHIVIHKNEDGSKTILLSKPMLKKIDISQFLVAEI